VGTPSARWCCRIRAQSFPAQFRSSQVVQIG
jgi:hypothetical protein